MNSPWRFRCARPYRKKARRKVKTRTDYGIPGGWRRANAIAAESRSDAVSTVAGDLMRGFGHWIVGNRIDQPDLQCSGCIKFLRGNEHLQGSRSSDESRQPLSSSPACEQTQGSAAV